MELVGWDLGEVHLVQLNSSIACDVCCVFAGYLCHTDAVGLSSTFPATSETPGIMGKISLLFLFSTWKVLSSKR